MQGTGTAAAAAAVTRGPGVAIRLSIRIPPAEAPLDIEASLEDTILSLKESIRQARPSAPPPSEQRLIFGGKQMADDKSAGHYNVEGGSVLHLVLALRGGGGL